MVGGKLRLPSHPTRVRGLKPYTTIRPQDWMKSHPTRVRGLKRPRDTFCRGNLWVAPHAGAWIETEPCEAWHVIAYAVAPHAGAWIETKWNQPQNAVRLVAPHAGAWIETP